MGSSLSNLKAGRKKAGRLGVGVFCMDLEMLSQREFAFRIDGCPSIQLSEIMCAAVSGYPKPTLEKRLKVRADHFFFISVGSQGSFLCIDRPQHFLILIHRLLSSFNCHS